MKSKENDEYLDFCFNQEFNKIPFIFRFSKPKLYIWIGFLVLWPIANIVFDFFMPKKPMKLTTIIIGDFQTIPLPYEFEGLKAKTILNVIFVILALWGIIGYFLEKNAFAKASRMAAEHSEWEDQRYKEKADKDIAMIEKVAAEAELERLNSKDYIFCPECGYTIFPEDAYCTHCGYNVEENDLTVKTGVTADSLEPGRISMTGSTGVIGGVLEESDTSVKEESDIEIYDVGFYGGGSRSDQGIFEQE